MKLLFSEQAWDDYLYWQQHDKKRLQRISNHERTNHQRQTP